MKIKENISLKEYNTFGIDAKATYFCEVTSINELKEAVSLTNYPTKFIISGGSNMLLTKDIDALVIRIALKGIEVTKEDDNNVWLKVMAGENWHQLVLWCIEHNYGGLENMSLIPGNTGTAPIQNIGAYGVELKDNFESCQALHISSGELHNFTKEDCNFGYRDSFFKNDGKGKYIITSVVLKLSRKDHQLKISYGAIEAELLNNKITKPTIKDVSNAVIAIRKSKLPDPAELGNSGSFFKNPIVDKFIFDNFIQNNPEAPFYKLTDDTYKIPAGWLIEQCGFKGKRYDDAGVHKNQALVLVNYGKATGKEILNLSKKIQEAVLEKFKIKIDAEVNIIK
ncbi:UDP-N-acetylmuramate dehydrogenase [Cellulophaga sp. 20_2_10]|uniref:UDP-N-acetylmuramate dehydrogenase n=1 Tax=Cellulophaga sp. 20_2_10 TaxID=2942476 RepID=UPI00201A9D5D|nr:UDP-N-acetylmuramate dehydrogenase [Cellulophaga sp. 20_2_10]MCL5246011.1 UDP-N-acetylmuramate dehydrogenase [Cellulophaga sp. 20_2_10]